MLQTDIRPDNQSWYVLNHIGISFQDMARKEIDRFNSWQKTALDLFAPTYVVKEEKNGQIRMKTANLTFHYVFVRGALPEIKLLCAQNNGFSFVIDHGSEQRYAIISDRDMASFQNIARAYKNCLPYFPLDEIDLEDGDLVEVIDGEFSGLVGTYMPRPRSTSGNIVLNVFRGVGTIAFNVKANNIRILEFSRHTTRANDQIDAFIPHLLNALRLFQSNQSLSTSLAAKLAVFCNRMEVVNLNNRKLQAKLQALLIGGNHILGNMEAADTARNNYEKLKTAITNPWTKTLVALILAVIDGDTKAIREITLSTPVSKAQQLIADELSYYRQQCP